MADGDGAGRSAWAVIISSVTQPINLFALIILAVVCVLGVQASGENQAILYFLIISVVILLILSVSFIEYNRPGTVTGRRTIYGTLADSIAEDIFFSMDGALENLNSENEQAEAWVMLMDSVRRLRPDETAEVRKFLDGLGDGIRSRARRRRPKLRQAIDQLEDEAARALK